MILCFKLRMPSNNSWDGKWSGRNKQYLKIVSFQGKKRVEKANEILNIKTPQWESQPESGSYSYNFGDGWIAHISVHVIDRIEAVRLRKQSDGFCEYDWMVDSIINNLRIIAPVSQNT